MNPVDIFGSGACAVTILFFAFIGIGRSIGAFVEKYPPLEYAGNGTLSLLLVHLSKGLVYWVLIGEAALWIAAFLADQWGVLV